jgi:hypothetical protein
MGKKEDRIKMDFFLKEAKEALDNAKKMADSNGFDFDFEGQHYQGNLKEYKPLTEQQYWQSSGGDTWSC